MAGFGAEVRRRREAAGLSLAEFAVRTHFSKGYLSKIERGLAPAGRAIAAVCDRALGARGELLALVSEQPHPDDDPLFLGRTAELDRLTGALRDPAVRAVVIAGLGGIGKTALALAAARDFPGRYVVVEAADGVDQALRALGVPGPRIPADPAGRLELLRETVRRKPVLLVLDDATSAAQVSPLLGIGRLLVTSRRRLAALDGAEHVPLGPLPADAARVLFRTVSGCADGDPVDELVDELVAACASVPLALRIVAARLRHGGWTAAELLTRLTDASSRIAAMDDGERSMAAVLGTSIEGLPSPERRLLALLGVHPGPVADLPSVAAMAGRPAVETEVLLGRLHESGLVTRAPGGSVVLHDLVRAAVPDAAAPGRDDALDRLADHLLAWTAAADAVLEPQRWRPAPAGPFEGDALLWLRAQWPVIVAVQERRAAVQLGHLLRGFFFREKLLEPWLRSGRLALAAAQEAGDPAWIARSLGGLGMAHLERGDLDAAAECHLRAGAVAGDPDAGASLAWVRHYQGRDEEALAGFGTALAAYERLGRRRSVGITLRGMALAASGPAAADHARRAFAYVETPLDRAMTLSCAAWVDLRAGRLDQAATGYAAAAEAARTESPFELARALTGLGDVAAARGDATAAARHWADADAQPVTLELAAEFAARAASS